MSEAHDPEDRPVVMDTTESTQVMFLDNREVERTLNVVHRLNGARKHHANPVLRPGPLGSFDDLQAYNYGAVIYQPERAVYQNWYVGKCREDRDIYAWGYAESRDGIHWDRPDLGLYDWKGSRRNNLVLPIGMGRTHGCSEFAGIIRDEREPDPRKRYKAVLHGWSIRTAYSPDGIHWDLDHLSPPLAWSDRAKTPFAVFETHSLMRDDDDPDPNKRYKMFGQSGINVPPSAPAPLSMAVDKPFAPASAGPDEYRGFRDRPRGGRWFGVAYSPDCEHWVDPGLDPMNGWEGLPPEVEPEIHIGTAWKRHGYYIAFYEPVHAHPETGWFTPDIRLAVSRDGLRFQRVCPDTPFIASGHDDWDSFLTTADANLIVGDEIWTYYCGFDKSCNYEDKMRSADPPTYQRATGVAIVKLDQFAGFQLSPGARAVSTSQGFVCTRPIRLVEPESHGLYVNVEGAYRNGQLAVGVCGPEGAGGLGSFLPTPLEGVGWSDPVCTDGVRMPVTWRGKSSLAQLSQVNLGEISLVFRLRGPHLKLFGFGFQ